MANRNTQMGGTNWANAEVLKAEDLNDTFDANIDTYQAMENYALPPIGSIIAYHYDWASSNSSVPAGWQDCNGDEITDTDSPMAGQNTPDLNGNSEATKRFLRGNSTSNTTGGTSTHSHSYTSYYDQDPGSNIYGVKQWQSATVVPPYFEVKWIMRIK